MIWYQYDINMLKLFKLSFANYNLHIAENIDTLFHLMALHPKFFFSGENIIAQDNNANDQNKRFIRNKMRGKNELFPLKLTFSPNNLTGFYFSSLKQI